MNGNAAVGEYWPQPASVCSVPEIWAENAEAELVHEATIGKIAGEQMIKLMSLGLTGEEAEGGYYRRLS